MRKTICSAIFTVVLSILLGMSSVFAADSSFFTDTSGHWAEEAINSVVEKGLFNGTSETTFSPEISMDRGMFVTVLGRFAEKMGAEVKGNASFEDVSQTAYYAPYVAWAADQGIVKGTSETTFSPADPVTREQMCALFIRLLDYAKYEIPSPEGVADFTDQAEISDYAQSNVMSATTLGLIKGMETTDGMVFRPRESATRAQVATVFLRLDGLEGIYEVLKPVDPDPKPSPSPDPDPTPTPGPSPGPSPSPSPDPDPTPTPVEPTEEDKALEAEVAGYITTMLQNYDNMQYVKGTDQAVQDCMKIITDCTREALNSRAAGTFLSKDYINQTYSSQIAQAKELYKMMNDGQKSQMDNVALRMGSTKELRAVLNYFGFNGVI